MAGGTPVSGASVQLYAAGSGGNGSAPLPLLSAPLTTAANGSFNLLQGTYSCPASNSVLYLVASGGAIGSAPNPASVLMTVPGSCQNLSSGASFLLDEVSTAASVYALRPFLAPGAQMGATSGNATGLALGAATLANLINLQTAGVGGLGFPATGTTPAAKLYTLANILHACVVSSGPASPACAGLFADTTSGSVVPANTLDAALSLANNPGANVAALFALSLTNPAFGPVLTAAPPDWTLPIAFTGAGMNGPSTVAIDGAGNVWVVNYFGVASLFSNTGVPAYAGGITGYGLQQSYGGAVDSNNVLWVANEETAGNVNNGYGSVTLLNTAGPALPGGSMYDTGGLNFPISVAIDSTNTAWIVDYGDGSLTLLNSAGVPQSGANGYTSQQIGFAVAVAVDSQRNGWLADQSSSTVTRVTPSGQFTSYTVGIGPSGVAIDAADNVWSANYYGNSVGLVSGGQVLSNGGFVGGGLDHPVGIIADGSGTVWVANYRAPGITELAGAQATVPGAPLSPTAGWAPDLGLSEAYGIAIDAAGNVWVTSFGDNRLVEYVGAAAPVKTPLLGATRVP